MLSLVNNVHFQNACQKLELVQIFAKFLKIVLKSRIILTLACAVCLVMLHVATTSKHRQLHRVNIDHKISHRTTGLTSLTSNEYDYDSMFYDDSSQRNNSNSALSELELKNLFEKQPLKISHQMFLGRMNASHTQRLRKSLKQERDEKKRRELERLIAENATTANICNTAGTDVSDYYKRGPDIVNKLELNLRIKSPPNYCTKDTFLLIFVSSHYTNFAKREDARKTWALFSRVDKPVRMRGVAVSNIKVIFIVARANSTDQNDVIAAEQRAHGDLIQTDFDEKYENLILKSLIGLKWATEQCHHAKFIMKIDDDILVNIPLVLRLLRGGGKIAQYDKFVLGHCYKKSRVFRSTQKVIGFSDKKRNSWVLSCDQFPLATFPDYVAGHGYIISAQLLPKLYEMAHYQRLFPIEDCFVTGVLRAMSGSNAVLHCIDGFSDAFYSKPFGARFPEKAYTYAVKQNEAQKLWTYLLNYRPKRNATANATAISRPANIKTIMHDRDPVQSVSSQILFQLDHIINLWLCVACLFYYSIYV